jgi:TPR repeat protein
MQRLVGHCLDMMTRARHLSRIPSTLTSRFAYAHTHARTLARTHVHQVHQGHITIPGAADPISVAVMRVRVGSVAAEAEVLLGLGRHPNLVRFFGICRDGEDELLVTELAPEGSLSALMERLEDEGTVIPPRHKHAMLQQVVSGLGALADAKVIHRDVAARNVLVFAFDPNDVARTLVKVSDFGLAVNGHTATHRDVEGGDRPIRYLPPEALRRGRYSEKSDVWAFGVLAWELLINGEIPYFEVLEDAIIGRVCGGLRLERPTRDGCGCIDELWRLLTSCWEEQPAARPTFAQLAVRLGQVGARDDVQQQQPPLSPTRVGGVGAGDAVGGRGGGDVAAAAAPTVAATAAAARVAVVAEATAVPVPPRALPTPPAAVSGEAEYAAGLDALKGRDGVPRDAVRARRLFEAAAGRGHARAQGELGRMLRCGLGGGVVDHREAARVLQRAVDNGDEDARRDLASMLWNGDGVAQDRDRAAELCRGRIAGWRTRAAHGDDVAQFCLRWCYNKGIGVDEDHGEAVRLSHLAAEQGHVTAQYNLGVFYANGLGVAQDHVEAVRILRLAAEQGDAAAQCRLGLCYDNGTGVDQDEVEAVRLYRLAAEQGHAFAQYNLGVCYMNGTGVAQNDVEAVRLFRLAAEQGEAKAQCCLGLCYADGTGVDQDEVEAVRLYRLAAEQGDAQAQLNLGVCYDNGTGVDQDEVEAVRLYRLAAEQGDANAQNDLGVCYENGRGVAQDHVEAVRLYRLAAEEGCARAHNNLGVCYENGTGVDQDHVEAVRLYRLAAEEGDEDAQENLRRLGAE